MSRRTYTVADSRNTRVRTTTGKKYYVVIPNGPEKAKVITRTNSSLAAFRAMNRWQDARVWAFNRYSGDVEAIGGQELSNRAQREKAAMADAKRHGYKHEAF